MGCVVELANKLRNGGHLVEDAMALSADEVQAAVTSLPEVCKSLDLDVAWG